MDCGIIFSGLILCRGNNYLIPPASSFFELCYLCPLYIEERECNFMEEDFNIRNQQLTSKERDFENALRPLSFEDFSGQDKVVENLRIL